MYENYLSPFAKEAKRIYGDFEPRGKPDDITIVVAQVHSVNQKTLRGIPKAKNG